MVMSQASGVQTPSAQSESRGKAETPSLGPRLGESESGRNVRVSAAGGPFTLPPALRPARSATHLHLCAMRSYRNAVDTNAL
jgi:hypothetical protein